MAKGNGNKKTGSDVVQAAATTAVPRPEPLFNPAADLPIGDVIQSLGQVEGTSHVPVEAGQAVTTADVAITPVEALSPPLVMHSVIIPMMPADVELKGFYAQMRSFSVDLNQNEVDTFRRFVAGLHTAHETFPTKAGKMVHVDSAADAFRCFIHKLSELERLRLR